MPTTKMHQSFYNPGTANKIASDHDHFAMIKKRGRGGIGAAHRQSQENMIKEEELSEEEDDEDGTNSSPYNRKTTLDARKGTNN